MFLQRNRQPGGHFHQRIRRSRQDGSQPESRPLPASCEFLLRPTHVTPSPQSMPVIQERCSSTSRNSGGVLLVPRHHCWTTPSSRSSGGVINVFVFLYIYSSAVHVLHRAALHLSVAHFGTFRRSQSTRCALRFQLFLEIRPPAVHVQYLFFFCPRRPAS